MTGEDTLNSDLGYILRAEEVARYLKVKENTVYVWAKRGLLPCNRIGRCVRFRPEDVKELVDRGRVERRK